MARIAASGSISVCQVSNVDLGSDLCGNFVHEHSLLVEPLVQDGYAVVTEKLGLGVELDEDVVMWYIFVL